MRISKAAWTVYMLVSIAVADRVPGTEYCGIEVDAVVEPLPASATDLFATYGVALSAPEPAPLSVAVVSPIDGLTVFTSSVQVRGTYTGPDDVGVTVNGIKADVHDGDFLLPALTLEPSTDTVVTVEAHSLSGDTATTTFTVTRGATPAPLGSALVPAASLQVGRSGPFAPADVSFQVRTAPGVDASSVDWDFDGDGAVDETTSPDEFPQWSFSTAGLHVVVATVHTDDGDRHEAEGALLLTDVETVRRRLCLLYSRLRRGLVDQDVRAALLPMSEPLRERYEPILAELGDQMPVVGRQLGSILTGTISDGFAELLVVRDDDGAPHGFHVHFDCGPDGVWRISQL